MKSERFDRLLGRVLRAGVITSGIVVAFGGCVFLLAHASEEPAYHIFREPDAGLRSLGGIAARAATLRGRGIIQLGLLILMATPVARVAFALVGFVRERDWPYVVITATVLLLIGYSLLFG
ncbi:MAG TPA: DUF1634 domain-containing protein [Vicinamibacterales bacterium]|nr:DUF1634 domain-containing protein [Vicinamibacterales bacterium]